MTGSKSGREAVLVVTSDKGLCGSYNMTVLKAFMEYLGGREPGSFDVFVIGKKGRDFFKRSGISAYREFPEALKDPSSAQSEIVALEVMSHFLSGKVSKVSAAYAGFKSLFSQRPVVRQILPIGDAAGVGRQPSYDFFYEPDKEVMLDKLLERYVKSGVHRVLVEAYTSEIAARRNAMENATSNASDFIDSLVLYQNKVRQQQITKEISEIVGTSEASAG